MALNVSAINFITYLCSLQMLIYKHYLTDNISFLCSFCFISVNALFFVICQGCLKLMENAIKDIYVTKTIKGDIRCIVHGVCIRAVSLTH